jgi:hypothetical protein
MKITNDRERNRYIIAEGDFRRSLECIKKAREYEADLIIYEALFSMAILLYVRPFSENEKGNASPASSRISNDVLINLSKVENALHEKFVQLRNQAIAHSESTYYKVKFDDETGLTRIPQLYLFHHSVNIDQLEKLVKKVEDECCYQRIFYDRRQRKGAP